MMYTSSRRSRLNRRTGGYVGREVKFNDVSADALNLTKWAAAKTAGTLVPTYVNAQKTGDAGFQAPGCLNAVQSNSGANGRIGRAMCMRSITINGYVKRLAAGGTNGAAAHICLWVVLDKQCNKAAPTLGDVFVNSGAAADVGPTDNIGPLVMRNLENSARFRVLKKWTFVLNSTVSSSVTASDNLPQETERKFSAYIPMKNLPVTFQGADGQVVNILDHSVHLMGLFEGQGASVTYNSRMRFVG